MGRYLSSASAAALAVVAGEGYLLPGQLPAFGSGRFEVLVRASTVITIKPGVRQIRVRVQGAGGGATTAGATSFGALISATGGASPNALVGGAGGVGIGGDYQAAGGKGGDGKGGGGGAAGSELGAGGAGGSGGICGGGGGAVGGKVGGAGAATTSTMGAGGASPFADGGAAPAGVPGQDMTGQMHAVNNLAQVAIPYPIFAFTGGGGGRFGMWSSGFDAGSGGGGGGGNSGGNGTLNSSGGLGGVCGGGGGSGGAGTADEPKAGGLGGAVWPASFLRRTTVAEWPDRYVGPVRIGGGQGGNNIDAGKAGAGGGGYARGVFQVEPGQQFTVTVAQQNDTDGKSGGMVILEY